MPRVVSLALRLARVAQARLDIAFVGGNSHDWDLAAADLLVHEAGGALTDIDGKPLIYNRPEPLHGALVAAGRLRHGTALASGARTRGRMRERSRASWLTHAPEAAAASGVRRRTELEWLNSRISTSSTSSASFRTTRRLCGLEGEGAADRRQRADALLHRAPAPLLDPTDRREQAVDDLSWNFIAELRDARSMPAWKGRSRAYARPTRSTTADHRDVARPAFHRLDMHRQGADLAHREARSTRAAASASSDPRLGHGGFAKGGRRVPGDARAAHVADCDVPVASPIYLARAPRRSTELGPPAGQRLATASTPYDGRYVSTMRCGARAARESAAQR